jgi:hypothetical protein
MRVSSCVAKDQPLDAAWDQVSSALLAVASCSDCAAAMPARTTACKHAQAELAPLARQTKKATP